MRRRFSIGIVLLIELALLFVVAEAISTLFLPPALIFHHPQKLAEPHSRRIWDLEPNQRAFTIDKPFVTNSLGFRDDREIPVKKKGELRVLSLGDSIAEGLGVSAEETYARQLEYLLRHQHVPVRVINAGVGCYSTWQEVDLLKEKGIRLQPEVVLLAFFWNDLYIRPGHVVPLSTTQTSENKDVVWRYVRWLKKSRVLSYLRERFDIVRFKLSPTFDWTHQEMIYEGRTDAYLDQAYNDVRGSLEEFKSLADIHGFTPILVIFPIPGQVRRPDAPTYMQRRLGAIASKLGLPMIDLLSPMQRAYAVKADLYIPWDNVHLSPRGHEVVAQTLERYFVNNGLVAARIGNRSAPRRIEISRSSEKGVRE